MLLLLFHVGDNLYSLDSTQVIEVIPRVNLRRANHLPESVAGVFNYRGRVIPVIDLGHLLQGQPSCPHLSTRILIVRDNSANSSAYVGLMAERVTETLSQPKLPAIRPQSSLSQALPYLGDVLMDGKRMIQYIHTDTLLADFRHRISSIQHDTVALLEAGDSQVPGMAQNTDYC